jgi:long-chain acyl-CoA synthetase
MILSSNGQNIYPEEIEEILNNMPYVSESLIIYRERKIVALIHPDWKKLDADKVEQPEIEQLMRNNINQLNHALPFYSKVSEFEIHREAFEKTPKRSIKRYLYQPDENNR